MPVSYEGEYSDLEILSEIEWTDPGTDSKSCINDLTKEYKDLCYQISRHKIRNNKSQRKHNGWRTFFKLALIFLTFFIATLNFWASSDGPTPATVKTLTFAAGLLAIFTSTVGTLDGFFNHSGRLSDARSKGARAASILRSAGTQWQVHVVHLGEKYKAYRNAVAILHQMATQLQMLEMDSERQKNGDKDNKDNKDGGDGDSDGGTSAQVT